MEKKNTVTGHVCVGVLPLWAFRVEKCRQKVMITDSIGQTKQPWATHVLLAAGVEEVSAEQRKEKHGTRAGSMVILYTCDDKHAARPP